MNQLTNREFAEQNQEFREACYKAGITPTARQASKFRNRHGKSYETWLTSRQQSTPIDTE